VKGDNKMLKNAIGYLKHIKQNDPAVKSNLETLLYPTVYAILTHRIAHHLYNKKLYFLARLLSQVSRFFTGIEIHPAARIGKNLFIDHGMGVVIGETSIIGNNVTIYQGVTLGGTGKESGKRHPTVEDNVMIGAGSQIIGAITIAKGTKIGAGSVVVDDTREECTVVGIASRIINKNVG
jgi:serine O-acetyltransferase